MGSTSSLVVPGTEIVNSPSFSRGSSIGRRGSTLSHEIFAAEHNGNTDDVENSSSTDLGHGNTPVHSRTHSPRHTSSPRHQAPNAGVHPLDPDYTNPNSSVASLSLRYPVPPMAPVMRLILTVIAFISCTTLTFALVIHFNGLVLIIPSKLEPAGNNARRAGNLGKVLLT
ncbi:hypothetical protein EDC04DRAFT_1024998 [Pisolithus marmoratus]|nr:hypothetical protein EDC04DRAFT_1024998 [Pisolithus marmoratus]